METLLCASVGFYGALFMFFGFFTQNGPSMLPKMRCDSFSLTFSFVSLLYRCRATRPLSLLNAVTATRHDSPKSWLHFFQSLTGFVLPFVHHMKFHPLHPFIHLNPFPSPSTGSTWPPSLTYILYSSFMKRLFTYNLFTISMFLLVSNIKLLLFPKAKRYTYFSISLLL